LSDSIKNQLKIEAFKTYLPRLEDCLIQILNQQAVDVKSAIIGFDEGVYIFIENGNPIYVGRTNRMSKRLREHFRGSHYSAHFAFNIARENTKITGINRSKLLNDAVFKKAFDEAKERVAAMQLKYIPIKDDILQALFEIYAAIELKTTPKYNSFKTS